MNEYDRRHRCKDQRHCWISVHRDLPGNHDEESFYCWCLPFTYCPTCEPDYRIPSEAEQIAEIKQ